VGDPRLEIKRLDAGLPLPRYQHTGDAGLDLHAASSIELAPGERAVVGTGIAVAIPVGYVGLTAPRSGLAARVGLSTVNAPGVIDAGYRGEIKLIIVNLDPKDPIEIERGDRIAQLLLIPVARADVVESEDLPGTDRGDAGLGSTGT
jgi:dUTP pyrophosphatase